MTVLPGTGGPSGASGKVLVVDDDEVFRRGLVRTLEWEGYECIEAATAQDARVQLAAADDVAALLCDVRMPGESGLELLQELTADRPDLAVVMVTGVDDLDVAQVAFDIGAYGYLAKPFERNELLISLAGAMARRALDAERRRYVASLERTIERTRGVQSLVDKLQTDPAMSDQETIDRLARALSLRDEETGRHIERMSRYAAILAEATGAAGLSSEQVRLVTALHDVGKIGVSDSILLKPGALTPSEYSAMQRHAQIGYQLLAGASSALVLQAAEVAHCHHEWWDGGGYPRGLREDEIPVAARIAGVTDVFDALTSDRVYRPGLPVGQTMELMRQLRGRQFEPRLIDALLEALPDVLAVREDVPDDRDDLRIRVLVVDDHELFVQSLVRLLGSEPQIKVVGHAATVAEGVRAATAYEPDVVLMDFELPDGTGVDATRQIKALLTRVKVVMLTGRTDNHAFTRAIEAGCAGFVTKNEGPDTLVDAIRAAHEGEPIAIGTALAPLLRGLRPTRRGVGAALARREVEVLGLVAEGLSNKDIALRLSLSLNTVRNHVQSILAKLHVHSRLEAVATAVKEGLVDYNRAGRAS